MAELGFDEAHKAGSGIRDFSPDSVIFTVESNFSGSSSVGRCSFISSDAANLSPHLAGLDISSDPYSDPNKSKLKRDSCRLIKKAEKSKAQKDDDYLKETYIRNETVESARSSFSQALKECQDRRSRSDTLYRNQDRRKPDSLDLNNHDITAPTSPKSKIMKKNFVLSPVTPKYGNNSVTGQKGWSSERMPLRNNTNRNNINASLFYFPNGKTLPSKWEDAERWIISPNTGENVVKNSIQQHQRRPKAKSGPLGPPGFSYNNSLNSPIMPMFEGEFVGNLVGKSQFLGRSGAAARIDPYMERSVSIHGCTEIISQSTHQGYRVEVINSDKEASKNVSRIVSRRDMATQMSSDGSSHSSPISRLSFSLITPSPLPLQELESVHSSKSDVRDVQVDKRVTMTRWSKKNKVKFQGKMSENLNDWRRKAVDVRSSGWEVSDAAKNISKFKRDEANISAWENLQKAKADAAVRKLEMKLEKKRSSSMDKIMNKLRLANKKAQEMRSSMLTNQSRQVSKTSYKVISFRPTRHISSLSGCFTCHAF